MADTPTGNSRRATSARTPLAPTPPQRTPLVGRSGTTPATTTVHTPLDRTGPRELANSVRRGLGTSGRRNNNNNAGRALTPHGAAARRALEQRRNAMFTPGKDRRRSMREQHQTPMNLLNQLARRLAPSTQQVTTSSSPAHAEPPPSGGASVRTMPAVGEDDDDDDYMDGGPGTKGRYDDDDDDDEQLPPPPRLSLPLQDEDDTSELLPPRLSEIPDDNRTGHTVRSVELPRDRPQSRYSRGSFGSVAAGDYTEVDDQTMDVTARPSDFFSGQLRFDLGRQADDTTMGIERIDNDVTMRTTGRASEFSLSVPLDMGDQTTFMMSEPGDAAATSPLPGTVTASAAAGRDAEDTYANISFISKEPGVDAGAGGDNDDDDDDNEPNVMDYGDDQPDVMDYDDPTTMPDAQEEETATTTVAATAAAEDTETGRRRSRPLADTETFISEGEDSDAGDATTTTPRRTSLAGAALSRSSPGVSTAPRRRGRKPGTKPKAKQKRISRHGTEYPPLPPAFVRRVANRAVQTSGLSSHRISSDVLAALAQASDWFMEQLGDDLGAYADHAKRTVIDESDVITLMKRQRQIRSDATLFSLAQKHLPRELLQELRMAVPTELKDGVNKSLSRYNDDDDDGSE